MQSLYQLTEGQIRINFISRVKFHLQYQPYLLWDNTFPYKTQNTIIQQVFWFRDGAYSMTDTWNICQRIYPDIKADNIVVFTNDSKLKSIPDVSHYQIFINLDN